MENEIREFERGYMNEFKRLAEIIKQKKQLEDMESKVKANLKKAIENSNVKTIDNEFVRITWVDESTQTTIDLSELAKREPELYAELLSDYPKVTRKSAYLMFKVK